MCNTTKKELLRRLMADVFETQQLASTAAFVSNCQE